MQDPSWVVDGYLQFTPPRNVHGDKISLSDVFYWGGYFWQVHLKPTPEGVGIFLVPSVDRDFSFYPDDLEDEDLDGPLYSIRVSAGHAHNH